MILYRTVFRAKLGKADQLVAAFKAMDTMLTAEQLESLQPRILTDISGPTDTVVFETTHESLAAVEQFRKMVFARTETSESQARVSDFVISARNEYYTIET